MADVNFLKKSKILLLSANKYTETINETNTSNMLFTIFIAPFAYSVSFSIFIYCLKSISLIPFIAFKTASLFSTESSGNSFIVFIVLL